MGTFPQHNLKIYIVTFIRQSRLSLAYTTKKMYINLYEPSMHGFNLLYQRLYQPY